MANLIMGEVNRIWGIEKGNSNYKWYNIQGPMRGSVVTVQAKKSCDGDSSVGLEAAADDASCWALRETFGLSKEGTPGEQSIRPHGYKTWDVQSDKCRGTSPYATSYADPS